MIEEYQRTLKGNRREKQEKEKKRKQKKKKKKEKKFFFLPSKTMGCFSGCLMSAASDQKLFCELCSASIVLLMNLQERKWSPRPIPPPSWLLPPDLISKTLNWQPYKPSQQNLPLYKIPKYQKSVNKNKYICIFF